MIKSQHLTTEMIKVAVEATTTGITSKPTFNLNETVAEISATVEKEQTMIKPKMKEIMINHQRIIRIKASILIISLRKIFIRIMERVSKSMAILRINSKIIRR